MNEHAPAGTSLTHTVADWLMSQALTGGQGVDRIVEGCCARLSAAGIPIWGANVSFRTLHPLFRAMSVTWMRDAGVASTGFGHQGEERENRRLSPINRLITTRVPVLRRRLTGPEALYDFPILDELRDKGATDYLAFVVPFNEDWSDGIGGSWATDRASGFSDGDIRELLRIQQRLAVACKVKIKDEIARNIVDAYLGHKAGSRVIAGRIKRGDAETIHAAIWYSDLRNSTGFAESSAACTLSEPARRLLPVHRGRRDGRRRRGAVAVGRCGACRSSRSTRQSLPRRARPAKRRCVPSRRPSAVWPRSTTRAPTD